MKNRRAEIIDYAILAWVRVGGVLGIFNKRRYLLGAPNKHRWHFFKFEIACNLMDKIYPNTI
jgi:hypothetical protein